MVRCLAAFSSIRTTRRSCGKTIQLASRQCKFGDPALKAGDMTAQAGLFDFKVQAVKGVATSGMIAIVS
ncbi:MAG: hypothetical protein ACREVK_03115 [Gammaproteobacteria bacterium]